MLFNSNKPCFTTPRALHNVEQRAIARLAVCDLFQYFRAEGALDGEQGFDSRIADCYLSAMAEQGLRVMAVVGSLKKDSVSRAVLRKLADMLSGAGCEVDWLDLGAEALPLFNPDTAKQVAGYAELKKRVDAADVFILGTPDYHGSINAALKNFLDYFWHEFSGKLFIPVVASHEKGLTVIDQIRTIARQCYAWVLPYGISAADKTDVAQGEIISKALQERIDMLARDARVYGALLARQRSEDLACEDCTFMARHRSR